MEKIYILVVDDQQEVLDTTLKDLERLEDAFVIEECIDADEASQILESIHAEGDYVALIVCDHVMPGKTGVDFLIELEEDSRFQPIKKILLTGLATHQDTIQAINQAAIDRYIEKPWQPEKLQQFAQVLLTEFILENGIDYQAYLPYLDQETLFEFLRQKI
jgi:two-component system chemotaxis response regulator CheY